MISGSRLPSMPIIDFLNDGTVGLRLVGHAETVDKERHLEVLGEELVERVQDKHDKVIAKKLFEATDHVDLHALEHEELKVFRMRPLRPQRAQTFGRAQLHE